MAKLIWAIIFGLLPFSLSLAQKYDYHWTFADSCGIDFSDLQNPKFFNSYSKDYGSSDMQTSISDENGKIIAYWAFDTIDTQNRKSISNLLNAYHLFIKNSDNIWVNEIFSNGSILIPFPNDSSKYYFFSIASIKGDQKTGCQKIGCTIFYAILQVLSNQRIEILQKNQILLEGEFSNKLAAIRHANGRDWWLLAHESISNRFIRFIITPNGITAPAYQTIGRGPNSLELKKEFYYWRGEMVISPKGNWLCIGATGLDLLELYRFNRCNGLLSDLLVLGPNKKISYDFYNTYGYPGVSFSPDESKLYVSRVEDPPFITTTRYLKIFQYDINELLKDKKYEPLVVHEETSNGIAYLGAHELGPDGKIYLARAYHSHLNVINKPNEQFPACDFVKDGFFLQGKQSRYGLPSFPVFRVPTLTIPTGRIDVTVPDCPEQARVIGQQDYKFYIWDDGSNEDLRYLDYKPSVSKYIRWAYDLEDTVCAVRCDTFYVTFRPAYLRISTSQSRQICQDDSLRIGDNQQCDTCYYRWLPRTGLTNSNAKQTVAKPTQTTTYVRSTYIPNGCVVGTDTVFITVIEKHVLPCTSVSRPETVPEKIFTIYPNPAQETITIRYPVQVHYHLTLLDITGRELLSFRLNRSGEHTFDVSTLPEGVYILKVDDHFSEKLVIVR